MSIKNWLRVNTLARAFRESAFRISNLDEPRFKSVIRHMDKERISTVMDVGANIGQFGIDIRRHGFQGQIVSYEPVRESFNSLTQTLKRHQPWKAFQLALGSAESERTINVSGNAGLSSSILEIRALHLENFPDSATIAKENVSISTIDKQLEVLRIQPREIMLKLDVQGFEAEVLKGATHSLSEIPLCYLEVSIIPLYEGEVSFLPILIELSKFGHEVIDVFRGIKTNNGQLLQLDILTKLANE